MIRPVALPWVGRAVFVLVVLVLTILSIVFLDPTTAIIAMVGLMAASALVGAS